MPDEAVVGGAEYELDLDTSKFEAKASEAGSFLQTTIAVAAGIEFQRIADDLKEVGQELFDLVVEFGHTTVDIQNMGQVTEEVAGEIAAGMLEISRESLFSASALNVALGSVAGRLELLTGKQIDVKDSTTLMTAATDLATASQQDLTSSANALISVMLAYKIPLEDASRVSDVLFNVTRLTGVGFDTLTLAANRLRERLGLAAPDLVTMGSLLAELNAQGLTGNRGLLVLVSGINELTSGSKDSRNELNRLGVGVYDAQGQFVGFRSIIEQLSKAYANLTPEQQKYSADLLFTKQSSNIFLNLIHDGVGTLDNFSQKIGATGTAADGAKNHIDDLKGQMELLKNNVEATAIEFGEKLEPAILKIVESANKLVGFIKDNQGAMEALAFIAGGVLVSGLFAVALAFWAIVPAAVGAALAENAALLGIPIIIASVIAALVLLYENWDKVKQGAEDLLTYFQDHWAKAIVSIILGPLGIIFLNWSAIWNRMPEPVQDAMNLVAGVVETVINTILGLFEHMINAIGKGISELRAAASNFPGGRTALDQFGLTDDLANALQNFNAGSVDLTMTGPTHEPSRTMGRYGPDSQFGTGPEAQLPGPVVTGPPAPPSPYPEAGGSSKSNQLSQAEQDLLALAAAFAVWHAQFGGTIDDFRVYLKLQYDQILVNQKVKDTMIDLRVAEAEAADQSYQLKLTWISMAEEAIRTGKTIAQVIRDTFSSIADQVKGTLDQILNAPTREGTQLQLRIDKLQYQADLLIAEGADASRVDNAGKPGAPQPTSKDRQLKALEDEIKTLQQAQKVRQDEVNIIRDENTLSDKRLQTDAQLINATIWARGVLENLSTTVVNLDAAFGKLLDRLGGIPQYATGISYVPSRQLAVLDPGERVLTAAENSNYNKMGNATFNQAFSIYGTPDDVTMDRLVRRVEEANQRSLRRWRGSVIGDMSTNG